MTRRVSLGRHSPAETPRGSASLRSVPLSYPRPVTRFSEQFRLLPNGRVPNSERPGISSFLPCLRIPQGIHDLQVSQEEGEGDETKPALLVLRGRSLNHSTALRIPAERGKTERRSDDPAMTGMDAQAQQVNIATSLAGPSRDTGPRYVFVVQGFVQLS